MSQRKTKNDGNFFKLTRKALESYKKDDPLEKTRNPRVGYFKTQWDINMGIAEWFSTLLIIVLAIVADIVVFPFQVIYRVISKISKTPIESSPNPYKAPVGENDEWS